MTRRSGIAFHVRRGNQAAGCVLLATASLTLLAASVNPLAAQDSGKPTVVSEKVEEGIRIRTLSDGSTQFIRPDGTQQIRFKDGTVRHTLTDGRIVTDRPDGTREVIEAPPGERRPRVVDGGYQNSPANSGEGGHDGGDTISPVKPPMSTGKHADWREFEAWQKSEEAEKFRKLFGGDGTGGSGDSGADKYISEQKLDGGITAKNRRGGGTDFYYDDGTLVVRDSDGTETTTYPNGQKAIRYPGQDPVWAQPTPGGGSQYPTKDGTGKVIEIPGVGTVKEDGGKRVLTTPNGGTITEEPGGIREVRGPDGELIVSEKRNSEGNIVRTDRSGETFILDPTTGGVISRTPPPGTTGAGGASAGAANTNTAAGSSSGNSGSETGNAANASGSPPPNNIFAIAKEGFKNFQKNPDMLNQQRQQLQDERDQLEQVPPTNPNYPRQRQQYQNNLDRFMQQLRQIQAYSEVAKNAYNPPPIDAEGNVVPAPDGSQAAAELEKVARMYELTEQRIALEQQQETLRQEKAELDEINQKLAQDREQLAQQEQAMREEQTKLQRERDAIQQEDFSYGLAKQLNDQEERLLDMQLDRAADRIDFSLYNYCPNGASYSQCDHPREKQEWFSDQLDRFLGQGYWDRYNEMSRKKSDLEDKKFDLDQRKSDLQQSASRLGDDTKALAAGNRVFTGLVNEMTNRLNKYSSANSQLSQKASNLKAEMDKVVGK